MAEFSGKVTFTSSGIEVVRLVKIDKGTRTTVSMRSDRHVLQSVKPLDKEDNWTIKGRVSKSMWTKVWINDYIEKMKRAGYTAEAISLEGVS